MEDARLNVQVWGMWLSMTISMSVYTAGTRVLANINTWDTYLESN